MSSLDSEQCTSHSEVTDSIAAEVPRADAGDAHESGVSSSTPPNCDWFLPSPVSPCYAAVCDRHPDEDDENVNGQRCASLSRINSLVSRLLCFLADAEHIDSWLRYNIERQCVDLQTLTQSVSGL